MVNTVVDRPHASVKMAGIFVTTPSQLDTELHPPIYRLETPAIFPRGCTGGLFWTRPKIISAVVIAILLLSSIVCIYQSITIQQRQSDIQGKIGDVWNEVDRASQLLQQDAALLNTTIASQNDAIVKIAQARSNMVTIIAGQGTSDTNAALAAATRTSVGIRSFVDSYPDYRVGSKSHSVLVQIEGSFYSRCTCWVVRRSSRRRLPSLSSQPIISPSTTSLAAAELRTLER